MDDAHEEVGDLFLAALELSGQAREDFVQGISEPDLRSAVRRLLRGNESSRIGQAEDALEEGIRELGGGTPESIGGYRILRQIGAGGMGIVYEAQQADPERRVALKVVRAGLLGEGVLRRFRDEVRVLGWLEHRGIARVYEAGTDTSAGGAVPWLAMELVAGRDLMEHCQAEALGLEPRVRLLLGIADAVHYAHGRGVIHRDLKPGNILVDGAGEAKVLDFGVARITTEAGERSHATLEGELIGTLAYMSPEQLEGDPARIDVRTDVYALGAIAYQLLSGQRPVEPGERSLTQAVRYVAESEAAPLLRVAPRTPRDLALIVHKALAKDPDQRYASVEELRDDLQRFLAKAPVHARTPSLSYRMTRFAQRNRALVLGLTAVVIALLAGTAVSLRFAFEAGKQARIAEAVRQFLNQDVFEQASPYRLGGDVTLRSAMDAAAARLDAGRMTDDPDVELELRLTLGKVYTNMTESEEARRHLVRAGELIEELGLRDDPRELKRRTALIGVDRALGDLATIDRDLEDILADASRLFGEEDLVYLAALQEKAKLAGLRQDVEAGLPLIERVLAGYRAVGESGASLVWLLIDRTRLLLQRGDVEAATASAAETLALARETSAEGSAVRGLCLHESGVVAYQTGRFAEAAEWFREALQVNEAILGRDDTTTSASRGGLANALADLGRSEESLELLLENVDLHLERYGEQSPDLPIQLVSVSFAYSDLGRYVDAEEYARQAVELADLYADPQASIHGNAADSLAKALRGQGRFEESLAPLERAERSFRRSGPLGPGQYITRALRVETLAKLERFEEAETEVQALVDELSAEGMESMGIFLARSEDAYGKLLRSQGRDEEAEAHARRSFELLQANLGAGHPWVEGARTALVDLLQALGRSQEAEALTAQGAGS